MDSYIKKLDYEIKKRQANLASLEKLSAFTLADTVKGEIKALKEARSYYKAERHKQGREK